MIVLSFASLFVVYLRRYGGFVNTVREYHVRSEHWGLRSSCCGNFSPGRLFFKFLVKFLFALTNS